MLASVILTEIKARAGDEYRLLDARAIQCFRKAIIANVNPDSPFGIIDYAGLYKSITYDYSTGDPANFPLSMLFPEGEGWEIIRKELLTIDRTDEADVTTRWLLTQISLLEKRLAVNVPQLVKGLHVYTQEWDETDGDIIVPALDTFEFEDKDVITLDGIFWSDTLMTVTESVDPDWGMIVTDRFMETCIDMASRLMKQEAGA